MRIKLRKLSDVRPYPGNPRQNDAAVDAVAESIRQFGPGAFQASGTAGPQGRERPTGSPPGRGDKMWRERARIPRRHAAHFLAKLGKGGCMLTGKR